VFKKIRETSHLNPPTPTNGAVFVSFREDKSQSRTEAHRGSFINFSETSARICRLNKVTCVLSFHGWPGGLIMIDEFTY